MRGKVHQPKSNAAWDWANDKAAAMPLFGQELQESAECDGFVRGEPIYTVRELMPEGWHNITPSQWTVEVVEGSSITCAKFGNVKYGSISGWKFLDWNMNEMLDGDEPGIEGWNITLTGWLNDGPFPWYPLGATVVGPITI